MSASAPPAMEEGWISGHIHHHQSLDSVIRGFVHPLAATLVARERIDGFFFVRHGLGGPHVRLRLQAVSGAREEVVEAMALHARDFLAREPSSRSMDEEAIRRANSFILEADQHEVDDSIYPDNWFHFVPFRPEIERYGGPGHYRVSLDYFTLASVAAVDFLVKYGGEVRSIQLARAFDLLLRQALGFAIDSDELSDLLNYAVDSWGRELPKVVAKADAVAQSTMEQFLQLFSSSVTEVRALRNRSLVLGASPTDLLAGGAARLSATLDVGKRGTRARVGGSQLHMTASRLGLANAEEVYLSRLMARTLTESRERQTIAISWLPETPSDRRLDRLRPLALRALVGLHRPGKP